MCLYEIQILDVLGLSKLKWLNDVDLVFFCKTHSYPRILFFFVITFVSFPRSIILKLSLTDVSVTFIRLIVCYQFRIYWCCDPLQSFYDSYAYFYDELMGLQQFIIYETPSHFPLATADSAISRNKRFSECLLEVRSPSSSLQSFQSYFFLFFVS